MKKFLQKIFKKISYSVFAIFYGKIEKVLERDNDSRIKVENIKIEKDIKYNVYKIADGRLYTDRIHDTAIILDNKIIEGPSFQLRHSSIEYEGKKNASIFNSRASENVVLHKGTPRIIKKLNGTTLSLLTGGAGNNNYWHWIFDVLPRIGLCSKVHNLNEIDYFLLPSLLEKFQNETLDILKIPVNKRLSSEQFRHIKAKELIVTDHPVAITNTPLKDIQNIPSWIFSWLKNSFVNKNLRPNKEVKKKIYIERKDSKYIKERFITNENEVREFLLKNNFVPVILSDFKFLDQVNMFYNAECIVGLHGGGFANTVFCKPRTKVIEFRGTNAGRVIENLSKANNLNYQSIVQKSKQEEMPYPNQQGSINIPISNLSKLLEN